MNQTMTAKVWLMLLTLSVLWGGSFFFAELALRDFGPLTVVLGRVGFAALALNAVVYLSGERMPGNLRLWGAFLVMGALNNFIPFSLVVWGQVYIDSGLAAILNATTPLFTVLLAHLLTKDERLTPGRAAGVLIGFLGVVVLIGPDALGGLGFQGFAQLAVLAAALSYAFAGIYGRRFHDLPASVAASGMVSASAIMMLPVALALELPWTASPSVLTWASVIGLALLSTAWAYLLYFRILAAAGATNLLLVTFLIPVSALVLGMAVLGERPHWTAFAGMVFIFAGLAAIDGRLFSRLRPATSRPSPEP